MTETETDFVLGHDDNLADLGGDTARYHNNDGEHRWK
jgi:hypothetical protein